MTVSLIIATSRGQIKYSNKLPGVDISWTVRDLKQHLCDREGEDPTMIAFAFRGKRMNDDSTLKKFGIRNNSVIHMIRRVMGGGLNAHNATNIVNGLNHNNDKQLNLIGQKIANILNTVEIIQQKTNNTQREMNKIKQNINE
eukprot:435350_1